jgi:hypothetical protein
MVSLLVFLSLASLGLTFMNQVKATDIVYHVITLESNSDDTVCNTAEVGNNTELRVGRINGTE